MPFYKVPAAATTPSAGDGGAGPRRIRAPLRHSVNNGAGTAAVTAAPRDCDVISTTSRSFQVVVRTRARYSLNSMGPTPTPKRMRLSCNFVNVYTFTQCTRASLTDNLARMLARKSARVGRVGGQVGDDCRACPARGKLNAPRHADFRARRTRLLPTRVSGSRQGCPCRCRSHGI